jgi:hypothetical protein
MNARNMDEIESHISEVRANIERQRKLIHKLKADGHDEDIAQAEGLLRTLEESLLVLRERRSTILQVRRPHA